MAEPRLPGIRIEPVELGHRQVPLRVLLRCSGPALHGGDEDLWPGDCRVIRGGVYPVVVAAPQVQSGARLAWVSAANVRRRQDGLALDGVRVAEPGLDRLGRVLASRGDWTVVFADHR